MTIKSGVILAVVVALGLCAAGAGLMAQAPSKQPEFKTLKADFIPGEKTIFFDDFTDMGPGDAPPHFKARGTAPELREAGAVRQLTAIADGFFTPNLKELPANFTYETEVQFDVPTARAGLNTAFFSKTREVLTLIMSLRAGGELTMDVGNRPAKAYEFLGRKVVKLDLAQPQKIALWVQDGRLRLFLNGDKHFDFNQVEIAPIDRVELQPKVWGKGPTVGFRSVRFAESAPDFSQTILSSGRYVSHGILFDTGSDRLKPESAPAIQTVAKALGTNPNLKLLIEGHTDSVGNAASNLDLSKRRADAVKTVLVSQFSIDASRLTTNGLGATKPMDSNDTPQGRAQNRRVEFVKQ